MVVPLCKVQEVTSFNDLRPISILPVLSRAIEKPMFNQIRVHIGKYNVLLPCQAGFRRDYSCATALLKITDDIICSADSGKTPLLILLDYCKAFDTVNHELLLAILNYVGFSRKASLSVLYG